MNPYVPDALPLVLRELQASSGRRSAILCFPRLINLAEGRDVL